MKTTNTAADSSADDDYALSHPHPEGRARGRVRQRDRMIAVAIYEQTDIPPGMTCDEYRTRGSQAHARGRAGSLALTLLHPIRLLAHLTEPAPAPRA